MQNSNSRRIRFRILCIHVWKHNICYCNGNMYFVSYGFHLKIPVSAGEKNVTLCHIYLHSAAPCLRISIPRRAKPTVITIRGHTHLRAAGCYSSNAYCGGRKYVLGILLAKYVLGILLPKYVLGILLAKYVLGLLLTKYVLGILLAKYVLGLLLTKYVLGVLLAKYVLGVLLAKYVLGILLTKYVLGILLTKHVLGILLTKYVLGILLAKYALGILLTK